jgi:hypothetical protein
MLDPLDELASWVAREARPGQGRASAYSFPSGWSENGFVRLEALEQGLLDLVQPPLVLDDSEDACQSRAFLDGQQEGGAAVDALRLHGTSVPPPRLLVGIGRVNAV